MGNDHVAVSISVDLADTEAVAQAVAGLTSEHRVAGVLTYMEQHLALTASIAERFMLPGNSPSAVDACRDEHLSRSILAAANVPSARSYLVPDAETAVEYAILLGGPAVVLKPRSMGGSAGVRRADTPDQVRNAFHAVQGAVLFGLEKTGTAGVLIEEYLDGPEISLECVVLGHDTIHIAAITRKYLGEEPGFQETGHLVDASDPLLADPRIREVAGTP
ncbi:acetyl-CoA carboxylase biotin carboxylase subunit family protein [Streptomyces collinus]|uniref:ATP-grasp domain-containing protein n=1 Tax=Streptomyces collinus TaxID=42684 RepID=UPI0036A5CD0C